MVINHHDSGMNTSRDRHVTMGDHSSARVGQNETGRGSEEEQYGRLVRDGLRGERDDTSHSDVYDHATSPQRSTSPPTTDSTSQLGNDVYECVVILKNRLC
ncbi:hypothetical protein ACOMHN_052091 [Nucella lapillus]